MSYFSPSGQRFSYRTAGIDPPNFPSMERDNPDTEASQSNQPPHPSTTSPPMSSPSIVNPSVASSRGWSTASPDAEQPHHMDAPSVNSNSSSQLLSYHTNDPPEETTAEVPSQPPVLSNQPPPPPEDPEPDTSKSIANEIQRWVDRVNNNLPPASITTHSSARSREPPSSLEDNQVALLNAKVDSFMDLMRDQFDQHKRDTSKYLANSTTMLETIIWEGIAKLDNQRSVSSPPQGPPLKNAFMR